MGQLTVNIGASANDGTGDRPRTTGAKVNSNFTELYGWSRERVSTNRTYYVSTTGNDSNNGLSLGTAFMTVQKALTVISDSISIDFGVVVTVQVSTGSYTLASTITLGRFLGGGSVLIQGDTATPGNVILVANSSIGELFLVQGRLPYTIQGFRIQATTGTPIGFYANGGQVKFGSIEFYTGLGAHLKADQGGVITAISNYAVLAGSSAHALASGGQIIISSVTVTLSGTPAFTTFASSNSIGFIDAAATFSGSATGVRYLATTNSVINTGGGGAGYIPGNSSGSTATGGQYV